MPVRMRVFYNEPPENIVHIDGSRPRPLPMALGHEGTGVVDIVGAGVTRVAPGDHVVTTFVATCGHCPPCQRGRPALCEPAMRANTAGTLLSGARRLRRGGTPLNHHLGVSAFAEYAVWRRSPASWFLRTCPSTGPPSSAVPS